jgi:hypothetical protein
LRGELAGAIVAQLADLGDELVVRALAELLDECGLGGLELVERLHPGTASKQQVLELLAHDLQRAHPGILAELRQPRGERRVGGQQLVHARRSEQRASLFDVIVGVDGRIRGSRVRARSAATPTAGRSICNRALDRRVADKLLQGRDHLWPRRAGPHEQRRQHLGRRPVGPQELLHPGRNRIGTAGGRAAAGHVVTHRNPAVTLLTTHRFIVRDGGRKTRRL